MFLNADALQSSGEIYETLAFLGAVIIAGAIFGKLIEKINLPSITGYIIAGVIVGPLIGIFNPSYQTFVTSSEGYLEIISKITIGFIAFSIGSELWLPKFKGYGKKILIITLFQALATFIAVTLIVIAFKQPLWLALTLGSIATATAPAPILMIVKKYKARGQITDTLIPVTGLDDAVGIIVFGIALALSTSLAVGGTPNIVDALVEPVLEIVASCLIGAIIGIIFGILNNFVLSNYNKEDTANSLLTAVLIVVFISVIVSGYGIPVKMGVIEKIKVSSILMPMTCGFVYTNMVNKNSYVKQTKAVDAFTEPFMIAFFTLAGANLNFSVIGSGTVLLVALLYVIGRSIGKISGAYAGGVVSKAPKKIKNNLGLTLLPQGGVEIGLVITASTVFEDLEASGYFQTMTNKPSQIISTVVILGIFAFEIIGPILTKFILEKNNELHYKNTFGEDMHF